MPSVVLAVAGRLDARTGGSIYNRRMAEGLRARGWVVDVRELEGDFPQPSSPTVSAAEGVYAGLPDGSMVLADGLALCAMPDTIERHASRLRIVALVHLPIAATVGLDVATAARLAAWERRALSAAARVVVTGPGALPLLEPYGLAERSISVVEPGVDAAPLARGSSDGVVHLLSVATLNAGKGHEVLLRALASLDGPSAGICGAGASTSAAGWRLTCAGSPTREPKTAARLRTAVKELGLDTRVRFAGELGEAALARAWDEADVFVLATLRETYGMAVAEALAHGLPTVATTAGAIPALVGTSAGLVVPPGDVDALAEALERVLGDPVLRAELSAGAREMRQRLPTWDDAAGRMAAALEGM
ncbi:MAG: glycosyltransferase family 4 protein [Acidobacteriota bacterium]|nr:glycosyltransferase family 4 protein [Acidobacteriota bacterium]